MRESARVRESARMRVRVRESARMCDSVQGDCARVREVSTMHAGRHHCTCEADEVRKELIEADLRSRATRALQAQQGVPWSSGMRLQQRDLIAAGLFSLHVGALSSEPALAPLLSDR